jgi:hypothetical protein
MDEPALADLPGSTRAAVLTLSGLCGVGLLCACVLTFAIVGLAQLRASGTDVPADAGASLYRFAFGTTAFALCRGAIAAMVMRRSNTARKLGGLVEAAAIALGLLSWYGGPGFEARASAASRPRRTSRPGSGRPRASRCRWRSYCCCGRARPSPGARLRG